MASAGCRGSRGQQRLHGTAARGRASRRTSRVFSATISPSSCSRNLDDAEPRDHRRRHCGNFQSCARTGRGQADHADTEPDVTARLVTLLGRVGLGSLGPARVFVRAERLLPRRDGPLSDAHAGSRGAEGRRSCSSARSSATIASITTSSRIPATRRFDVTLSLTPDDRISGLDISEL